MVSKKSYFGEVLHPPPPPYAKVLETRRDEKRIGNPGSPGYTHVLVDLSVGSFLAAVDDTSAGALAGTAESACAPRACDVMSDVGRTEAADQTTRAEAKRVGGPLAPLGHPRTPGIGHASEGGGGVAAETHVCHPAVVCEEGVVLERIRLWSHACELGVEHVIEHLEGV